MKRNKKHPAHTDGTSENKKKREQFESCINVMRKVFSARFSRLGIHHQEWDDMFQDVLCRCWEKFSQYNKNKGACLSTYLWRACVFSCGDVFYIKVSRQHEMRHRVPDRIKNTDLPLIGSWCDARRSAIEACDDQDELEAVRSILSPEEWEKFCWYNFGYAVGIKPPHGCEVQKHRAQHSKLRLRYNKMVRDKLSSLRS